MMVMSDQDMTLEELTAAMNRFVEEMGWYAPASPRPQNPRSIAISLSLEAAEILEHFQWREQADADALSEELADVALYLFQLAHITGIDLQEAILEKLDINYRRFGKQGQ
jgi:NTP pyrophosphatase (non-canonical NTP hydrolase)